MTESPDLEDLLAAFLERREAGDDVSPAAFVAERGEMEAGARARLLAALERAVATDDALPRWDALPERVGPYRVLGEVGRGGMGRVLRVEHEARPGVELALKVLHVALHGNERALERFRREGEALARVEHPGVVRVHATGVAGGTPYIAMDLVHGTSLAKILADERRRGVAADAERFRRAARIVERVARAVAAAHGAGVLHRDVHPRNVILRDDGEPVLIDFGLMRAEDAPTLTGSGDMLGTPGYMAPEQARGERVDARTDVHGLGVLLFELLTGEPPRAADETLSVVRAAGSRPLPNPRARAADVPAALDRICRAATAFGPRWRTPSAAAVADDLAAWLDGRPIAARGPGLAERAWLGWTLHRRPIAAAVLAGLASLAVFAFATREGDAERLARAVAARNRVLASTLDGEAEEAARAADELAELLPSDDVVAFLVALANDAALPLDAETGAGARALARAESLRRAGKLRESHDAWAVAMGLVDAPIVPAVLHARVAYEREDWALVEALLAPAAGSLPDCPTVHRMLADAYLNLGKTADAAQATRTMLAAGGHDHQGDDELRARAAQLADAIEAAGDAGSAAAVRAEL